MHSHEIIAADSIIIIIGQQLIQLFNACYVYAFKLCYIGIFIDRFPSVMSIHSLSAAFECL